MKKQKCFSDLRFRNDIILIAALLIISAIGFLYLFVFRTEGNVVRVSVDGKDYGTFSLNENHIEEIRTGKEGENLNRFVISDGTVFMQEATCPDGICVSHRPVFRDGESIVCLPNRVVITVVDEADADAPDIVA